MLGSDGGVIAADTEIVEGDLKGIDTKILGGSRATPLPLALGLGGAGRLNYFESVKTKLAGAIIDSVGPTEDSDHLVEAAIESVIVPFYERNILPFRDNEQEELDVHTLALTWVGNRGKIWASDRTAVRSSDDMDVIGLGPSFALGLMRGYYTRGACVESLVILAAYVVWRCKHVLTGIGQQTQVMLITDGRTDQIQPMVLGHLETLFGRYNSCLENIFAYTTGMEGEAYFQNALSGFKQQRSDFDAIRQAIRAMRSLTSQT